MDGANGHAASESNRVGGAGERAGAGDYGDVLAGTVTKVPASIVQAICRIKLSLEAVKKTQRNAHGGYNFASADDIYAALTKKMGEVGLVCLTMEDSSEVIRVEKDGKTSQWLKVSFSFVLATAQDTWHDAKLRRTMMVQVTGAQTFQAAQSYAEKSFYRSLFSIPTGDMDLDAMPQADTEEAQVSLAGNSGVKRKSSSAAKKDGTTTPLFNEIKNEIANALNVEHLQHIREVRMDEWDAMPARWADLLNDDYETRMAEFNR